MGKINAIMVTISTFNATLTCSIYFTQSTFSLTTQQPFQCSFNTTYPLTIYLNSLLLHIMVYAFLFIYVHTQE